MIIRNDQQSALRRAAFTLMEILIVVAIIVALAGVGGFYFIGQLQSSKVTTTRLQAKSLAADCKKYYIRYSNWPQTLDNLYQTPDNIPILEDPKAKYDQWGQEFTIEAGPLNQPMIVSHGSGQRITSSD
jgi:prepilin-type N-terminal cleavage/methylation domain-containing protein